MKKEARRNVYIYIFMHELRVDNQVVSFYLLDLFFFLEPLPLFFSRLLPDLFIDFLLVAPPDISEGVFMITELLVLAFSNNGEVSL